MYICVDFDGTCVKHTKPLSSKKPIEGAVEVLKELVDAGHHLILFTLRSNKNGIMYLEEAVKWFKDNDIKLSGSQRNSTQWKWTDSPKAYGSLYIDDAAVGCPLLQGDDDIRPYVDWAEIRKILIKKGVLK